MSDLALLRDDWVAVVVGASGGIGAAVRARLDAAPRRGRVVGLSRSAGDLDLRDEATIAAAADRLRAEYGEIDLVFNAAGALAIGGIGPEKTIRALDPAAMAAQFAVNAVGPALLVKHLSPLLPRDRPSLFASITAKVGSIGDNRLGGWIAYRAAKAAHNQVLKTAAIELARTRPRAIVVALHPGTVATRLSDPFAAGHDRLAPDEAARRLVAVLSGLRPGDSGGFFAHDGTALPW